LQQISKLKQERDSGKELDANQVGAAKYENSMELFSCLFQLKKLDQESALRQELEQLRL
jgi:hypothetical protein